MHDVLPVERNRLTSGTSWDAAGIVAVCRVDGADVVMKDTMRYCDVVLRAASHFEFADIYGACGHRHLQRVEAVDPPEVWWAFLRRLGKFDPNDPAVQAAREDAIRHLVVSEEGDRTENS